MCGIVAVLRRPSDRTPPDLVGLCDLAAAATANLSHGVATDSTRVEDFLAAAAAVLRGTALRGDRMD